jgi:uncharacterized protein YyaL (SSP411 family)
VAVVGSPDDPARAALETVARRATSPGSVVVVGEPDGSTGSDIADDQDVLPLLAGRTLVGGSAAAYVCRGLVCERPVTSPDELAAALGVAP